MLYTMVDDILYKRAIMGFFSNASHRPRALTYSMISTEEFVGPILLIGHWSVRLLDKGFTGQQLFKMVPT